MSTPQSDQPKQPDLRNLDRSELHELLGAHERHADYGPGYMAALAELDDRMDYLTPEEDDQ